MRILVIGGSGFIGSHVVDEIIKSGNEAYVFDRFPEPFRLPQANIFYFYSEFSNNNKLEEILNTLGIDIVVHLVSTTLPQSSNDDPIFDIQTNLIATIKLLDLCVKYKLKKFIYISSGGTVYGRPQVSPVSERHPTLPLCSYGIVKLAIEHYLSLYHLLHGLNYVALRVSNPYGRRQNPLRNQGVPAVFMHKILSGQELSIWGDGSIIRDFVHVSDVARACLAAQESQYIGTCNVGSGRGLSLKQLITALEKTSGMTAHINWMPARNFDVPEIVLDCSVAERELSWKPKVELLDGLLDMQSWMLDEFIHQSSPPL